MKDTSPYHIWGPVLIALAIVLGMVIGMKLGRVKIIKQGTSPAGKVEVGRVEEVVRFVESHYVDSIDRETLIHSAIQGMLRELDPHSKFLNPDMLTLVKRDMYSEYEGVGIVPKVIGDSLYVEFVFSDSPAANGGLEVGDLILAVNGTPTQGMTEVLEEEHLFSSERDSIRLTISSKGQVRDVTLEKTTIALDDTPGHFMIDDSIGLIRIERFVADTYRHFMQALEELNKKGCRDLIIDVRGNSGGFLNETIKIISQFFEEPDVPITWAEGAHSPQQVFRTKGHPFFEVQDIVVLVDEQSASAAEILAGALQDLSRAVIVGRRTYGKGLVQEQYELPDGYALRLTTARYYLPSGRSIQRDYSRGSTAYRAQWFDRLTSGELLDLDSVQVADTTRYYTRLGKVVYGASGVIPDIFIPYQAFELEEEWSVFLDAIDSDIIQHYAVLKTQFPLALDAADIAFGGVEQSAVSDKYVADSLCRTVLERAIQENPDWIKFVRPPDSIAKVEHLCHYILSDILYASREKMLYSRFVSAHDRAVSRAIDILRSNQSSALLRDTLSKGHY